MISPDTKTCNMKREILLTMVLLCIVIAAISSLGMAAQAEISQKNADIVGAGATFPTPLYQRSIILFWLPTLPNFKGGLPLSREVYTDIFLGKIGY